MENSIFSIIIGAAIGILFFYYDSKAGKNLYRKWYNLSNKNKLGPKTNLGFVAGQLFGQRLTVAVTISIIAYALGFLVFGMNPFFGLFYALGLLVGLLLGFYSASKLLAVFSKNASKTIEYIESIEKGDKKVTDEINKILPKKEESQPNEQKLTDPPQQKEEPQPKKDDKKEDDWRKGVKDFLDN